MNIGSTQPFPEHFGLRARIRIAFSGPCPKGPKGPKPRPLQEGHPHALSIRSLVVLRYTFSAFWLRSSVVSVLRSRFGGHWARIIQFGEGARETVITLL